MRVYCASGSIQDGPPFGLTHVVQIDQPGACPFEVVTMYTLGLSDFEGLILIGCNSGVGGLSMVGQDRA